METQQNQQEKFSNNKLLIVLLLAVIALFGFIFYNNITAYKREAVESTDFLMDTLVDQRIYGKKATEATVETARRLREFENTYSMYVEGSVVSEINRQAGVQPVKLTQEQFYFFEQILSLCEQTNGVVDITIAPVVTLWGVTGDNPQVPSEEALQEALQKVDYRKIELNGENQTVFLPQRGMAIDLGAIAKGKACDIAKEVYDEYNILRGFISLGGNVYNYKKEDNTYLRDPASSTVGTLGYIRTKEKVIATSGAYERRFTAGGVEYHHIFDPATGYPAETDLASVTVVAEDGALADTMSTYLFCVGSQQLDRFYDNGAFAFIAVTMEGDIVLSPGLQENFVRES